jgi:hypothetical protein
MLRIIISRLLRHILGCGGSILASSRVVLEVNAGSNTFLQCCELSPPPGKDRLFFCLPVSPSVCLSQNPVLISLRRRLIIEIWNFVQCFIIVHILSWQEYPIIFLLVMPGGFKRSGGVKKKLVLTSALRRLIIETWNFVECFFIISTCAYHLGRRIQ